MPQSKAIKFIRAFATERETYVEGREYSFTTHEADQFIANGYARELNAAPPEVPAAEESESPAAPRRKTK